MTITEIPVVTSAADAGEKTAPVQTQELPVSKPAEGGEVAAADAAKTAEEVSKKPRGMSKAYATLKEKEAAVAKKEQELAEREQKLSQQPGPDDVSLEDLKKTPSKVLAKLGISFEDLANVLIKEGQEPGVEDKVKEIETKLQNLEKMTEEEKKAAKEKEDKAVQDYIDRAVKDYRVRLDTFIKSKPDDYELIIAQDAVDLVFETAEAYYNKNGKIPSMEESAAAVEGFLLERAKKLLSVKKLGVEPSAEPKKKAGFSQTLTNGDASFSKPSTNGISKTLSKSERIKKAAAMLKYN